MKRSPGGAARPLSRYWTILACWVLAASSSKSRARRNIPWQRKSRVSKPASKSLGKDLAQVFGAGDHIKDCNGAPEASVCVVWHSSYYKQDAFKCCMTAFHGSWRSNPWCGSLHPNWVIAVGKYDIDIRNCKENANCK